MASCRHADNSNFIAELRLEDEAWEISRMDLGTKSIDYLYVDGQFVIASGPINNYFFLSSLGFAYPADSRSLGMHQIYKVQKVLPYQGHYIFTQPEYTMVANVELAPPSLLCSFDTGQEVRLTMVGKGLCRSGEVCEYRQRLRMRPSRASLIKRWMFHLLLALVLLAVAAALAILLYHKVQLHREQQQYITFEEVAPPDPKPQEIELEAEQ